MDAIVEKPLDVSPKELINLCAVDSNLFSKTFFPKTVRDEPPSFDKALWSALENPKHRLVNLEVFRGAGKTTKLRLFAAKRIAYGISRTILYIGASESHATRSVQWLRSQIEARIGAEGRKVPSIFASTFGLRPGRKWQEHEIEIYHGVDERPIWVLGVGITGTIRGINFDDYRPDLIILDDVITDENADTEEQCRKIHNLIMGAVVNSLAPASEEPNAKVAMLQTPISLSDASAKAKLSSEWHTESFGCWTEDTRIAPLEQQLSSWPERFPTEELRKKKFAALAENRYSIFAREWEVQLVAAETCSFRPNWLKKWTVQPKCRRIVIAIDPVPPPSPRQVEMGLRGKDYEAISVVGFNEEGYHLLDYAINRGHEPNWTVAQVFGFHHTYKPLCWVVEPVAYQRVLKFLLENEMKRKGIYALLKDSKSDKRKKFERIISTLSGISSQGKMSCSEQHSEFILQFESYGIGYKGPEDLLDATAMAVAELTNPYLELAEGDYEVLDDYDVVKFPIARGCP